MFTSTIIPSVGRASLARSVQSILDQDFSADDFEVIVVNDSGRPLPAGSWQASPHVRVCSTERHGQSIARNTGAALAHGHYLHFLDDDDWLLPRALNNFWEAVQRHPQADWLYGGARLVDDDGRCRREFNLGLDGNAHTQLVAGVWIPHQSSIIRAEAFFSVGGFHPLLHIGEEIDLGRRITHAGDLAHTSAPVVCLLRGQGWKTSSTAYADSTKVHRWSRDMALSAPGAFGRLRASAGTPYWRGRILQAYLAAARWNWQRGNCSTMASRLVFALLSLATAGPSVFAPAYWQAVRDEHVPFSAGLLFRDL